MSGGSFVVGQRMLIDGQQHRVLRTMDHGVVYLEHVLSRQIDSHKISDLVRRWYAGEIILGNGSLTPPSATEQAIKGAYAEAFLQSYTKEQQAEAKRRLSFVERLRDTPKTASVLGQAIQKVWSDKKLWKGQQPFDDCPSVSTIKRWMRKWTESGGDIRSLISRDADKGSRDEKQHDEVQKIVEDLIGDRYLTLERPSLKSIHRDAVGLVAQRNACRLESNQLISPSYGFVRSQLQQFLPYDICRARYGQQAADIKFRAAMAGATAAAPLARATIDHTRLDIFVVDEESRLPLGRPWLTLVMDEHSRYILGYYLGFEEPSSVSMSHALRHAISPKETQEGWVNEWDAWGLMDVLVCDNGMEFHGRVLESGAGRFGITIQFCPRRKPWYKGKVERLLRTAQQGLLANVPGKTFSNIFEKGDYDPKKHALITLETLRTMFEKWIVDIYHQEPHRVLKKSPHQAWTDGIESVDRYLPPSSLAVESAFSISETREITHKGIEYDCLIYNSEDLKVFRQFHGEKGQVEIRVRNDDIGAIVVVSPDKTLIKVPAIDIDYASGMTRWQHKQCKKVQRRNLVDDAREISLLEARQEIRELMEQDICFLTGRGRSKKPRTKSRFLEGLREKGKASVKTGTEPPLDSDEDELESKQSAAATDDEQLETQLAAELAEIEDEDLPVFGVRIL